MTSPLKLSAVLASLALGACSPPVTNTGDTATQDAVSQDTTPADTGPTCVSTQPPANSPWCAMTGCPFRPVSLPLCDGTGDYEFYGPDYCNTTATLLVVSAGWCVPCMQEAPMIEQLITQGYGDRGVRVITVYAQNPDGSTPDNTHCNMWKNAYHLSSHMVTDPAGLTQIYTPMNAFPSNVIIDQNGNIYDVLYGTERGLTTMTSDLDAILAAQGR